MFFFQLKKYFPEGDEVPACSSYRPALQPSFLRFAPSTVRTLLVIMIMMVMVVTMTISMVVTMTILMVVM